MIDDDRTLQLFGYTSSELKPYSHKPVVLLCEDCGKHRIGLKCNINQICKVCSLSGKNNPMYGVHLCGEKSALFGKSLSDEHKRKISENHANMAGENNPFFGKHHTEATKQKLSKNNIGLQAGKNNPMYGVRLLGARHWNWQGGTTPWRNTLRSSQLYMNWRKEVFERDDYTCRMCNVRGGNLEAHHISPVRDNKNTLAIIDVNNGITLCIKCHNKTKGKEYDFAEWFESVLRDV